MANWRNTKVNRGSNLKWALTSAINTDSEQRASLERKKTFQKNDDGSEAQSSHGYLHDREWRTGTGEKSKL